jgi:predicted component of type VI protein secretion system
MNKKISYYIKFINTFIGVVTQFWVPAQKKKKIKKIKKYPLSKNITVKIGCQNTQKMVKKWLRRFKITKIKIWQYFVD